MIKQIKSHLNKSIQTVLGQKVEFIKQDEQAFTRKRSLSLETMIRTILGMEASPFRESSCYHG